MLTNVPVTSQNVSAAPRRPRRVSRVASAPNPVVTASRIVVFAPSPSEPQATATKTTAAMSRQSAPTPKRTAGTEPALSRCGGPGRSDEADGGADGGAGGRSPVIRPVTGPV